MEVILGDEDAFMKAIKSVLLSLWSRILVAVLRIRGVEISSSARVLGMPDLKISRGSRISIGENACIYSSAFANPLRPQSRTSLHTVLPGSEIRIGTGVGISSSTLVARERICIGNGTFIGAACLIVDNDFHSLDASKRGTVEDVPNTSPVVIGEKVFIGTRAIILKGVTIGDRAVIGAGSIVTKSIPPDSLAAGNPARVIKAT